MRVISIFFAFLVLIGSLNANPDTYPDFETLKNNLESIVKEYPNLIQLENQGTTLGDRQVLMLKLGTGNRDIKPAILLVGGVNGADLAGTEIIMRFIQSSVSNYGKIDSITKMLDQTTFYIFPRVNPDAAETLFLTPGYASNLNKRPLDLDSDGKVDEDGYDDLNKDGLITQMRITEAGGEWIEDKDYSGLLRKADMSKGEQGIHRLVREGFDNDSDGKLNEDESGGVNFNKNFTYNYKYFDTGSGLHQISEIETRAVVDFAFAHSNIAAVFSFSPNDNLITPWEPSKKPDGKDGKRRSRKPLTSVEKIDAPYYKHISDVYKKIANLKELPMVEAESGAFNEWAYYHYGRWSFSTLAWTPPSIVSKKDTSAGAIDSTNFEQNKKSGKAPKSSSNDKKTYEQRLWVWLNSTGQKSGLAEWKEIKHPDYPDNKVEVGGFNPIVFSNPPKDSLSTISQNFQTFMSKMSTWLPKIALSDTQVKHLHDNVYRLTLIVKNNGYLATNTQAGVSNKWCPKVKVALELTKEQTLVSGRTLNFIDILPGSGGIQEFNWLILGRSGESVKISVGSPMTGEIIKIISLK